MKLVVIESPYAGDVRRNVRYLQACIRDCIRRGESPYASHQMLTTALDDKVPEQRRTGIEAGLAWRRARWIDEEGNIRRIVPVFYTDLGISSGMDLAARMYCEESVRYEERSLPSGDPFFETLKAPAEDLSHDELVWLSVFTPNLARLVEQEPTTKKEEVRRLARAELAGILNDCDQFLKGIGKR